MEKLLVILDASAFSNSACLLRLFRITVEGYTQKLENNDVCFGTAFHLFRKIFRDKGDCGMAEGLNVAKEYFIKTPMVVKPNKTYLTPLFLMRICMEYAEKYVHDKFKPIRVKTKKWITTNPGIENSGGFIEVEEPLLELKGAFPYYVDDEIEILMAFTIDEIGKESNSIVSICDAKTTSVWNIKEYLDSYELSCQLRFYKWSLLKYAEAYPESFI